MLLNIVMVGSGWIVSGLVLQAIIRWTASEKVFEPVPAYFWSAVLGGPVVLIAIGINLGRNFYLKNKDRNYD